MGGEEAPTQMDMPEDGDPGEVGREGSCEECWEGCLVESKGVLVNFI